MALAGAPAGDLAVQPPAASTEAVDVTAGATIREDPGPAAATAAAAAAFFHVLSFCFFGYISQVFRVYALVLLFIAWVHTLLSCLVFIVAPCMRVWPFFFVEMDGREHEHNNILLLYGFIRPGIRV